MPAAEFDKAVVDWLEEMLRRSINDVFDLDLLFEFINEIAVAVDSSRLLMVCRCMCYGRLLSTSFTNECRWPSIAWTSLTNWQQLTIKVKDAEILTQRLREHVKDDLCRVFADGSGQLSVLLLDKAYEDQLLGQVHQSDEGGVLDLEPSRALALASVIISQLELHLMDEDVQPVVLCPPELRMPLFRKLRPFDPRIYVLSATEMSPEFGYRPAGLVQEPGPSGAPAEAPGAQGHGD